MKMRSCHEILLFFIVSWTINYSVICLACIDNAVTLHRIFQWIMIDSINKRFLLRYVSVIRMELFIFIRYANKVLIKKTGQLWIYWISSLRLRNRQNERINEHRMNGLRPTDCGYLYPVVNSLTGVVLAVST